MSKKYLTYALNSSGNIVFVEDVPTGASCGCYCPCCKEPVIAKNAGSKRIHHFAHASGVECKNAYESMLHLLAKERICKAFRENSVFNMQFYYHSFCQNYENCHFVHFSECSKESIKSFNLKEFYDSCKQEIPYDTVNRRSDIKLFSSINPNVKPLFIELFVTHASDEVKLHSGEKIIEIKIESEDDIEKIVQSGFVEDVKPKDGFPEDKPKTIFWGFKNEDYKDNISSEIQFVRYVLYQSGKTQCIQDCTTCNCIEKSKNGSLYEIVFHRIVTLGIYEMAKYQGYRKFGIKNCIICRNYVESYNGNGMICRLYKHLGISKWEKLDTARAKDCQCFSIDEVEMKMELQKFDNLPTDNYIEFYAK